MTSLSRVVWLDEFVLSLEELVNHILTPLFSHDTEGLVC